MRIHAYDNGRSTKPWPRLIAALDQAPLHAHQVALRAHLIAALNEELSRDPEQEDILATSQLLDMVERHLSTVLPWYGGVLRFSNTCLTGWTPQVHFLVQASDRVETSVDAVMTATSALPVFAHALAAAFRPIRATLLAGGVPITDIESVLDRVITVTSCRPGWSGTLLAVLLWMHESCSVPLRSERRHAMADWLSQSCLPGIPPSSVTRAEILSAMARSLRRPVHY